MKNTEQTDEKDKNNSKTTATNNQFFSAWQKGALIWEL